MTETNTIKRIDINDGCSPVLVSRVVHLTGTLIPVASITDIEISIFNLSAEDPGTRVYIISNLEPAAVYSDTLSYDYGNLIGDDGGINMLYVISYDDYPLTGGCTYRVQVLTHTTNFNHLDRWNVVVGEVL